MIFLVPGLSESLTKLAGMVGLTKGSDDIIGIAFDILALEALFLVPRFVRRYQSLEESSKLTDPCLGSAPY